MGNLISNTFGRMKFEATIMMKGRILLFQGFPNLKKTFIDFNRINILQVLQTLQVVLLVSKSEFYQRSETYNFFV